MKRSKYLNYLIITLIFLSSLIQSANMIDRYVSPREFYFIMVCFVLLIAFLIQAINRKRRTTVIKYNIVDILILAFTTYTLVNYYIYHGHKPVDQTPFILASHLIAYFLFRQSEANPVRLIHLLLAFPFICSIHGILEFHGLVTNEMEFFNIGASFGNPGPYSNFLVASYPILLGVLFFKRDLQFGRKANLYFTLAFLTITYALVISNGRTAWLGMILSVIGLVLYKYPKMVVLHKGIVVITGCLIFVAILIGLTKYKHESTLGRKFIWELSLKSILEKPITGVGYGSFTNNLNNLQAEYFESNPDDKERGYLADNGKYAFNDFLHITVETGILGLILFLLPIIFILLQARQAFKAPVMHKLGFLGLCVILLGSLTSYPLQSIPTYSFFMLYMAVLSEYLPIPKWQLEVTRNNLRLIIIGLCFISLPVLYIQYKRVQAQFEWSKAYNAVERDPAKGFRSYQDLYPSLRYDGFFLYNYGAQLSVHREYKKSISILKECSKVLNDADTYTYLGNSYEGLDSLLLAEKAYRQASLIVPHRLFPRYRLAYVYAKMGEIEKAQQTAMMIYGSKPKVRSTISDQIKKDMEKLLQQIDQEKKQ